MSQQNVEVVKRIYADVLADDQWRDPAAAEVVRELFDPEVEVQQMEEILGTAGTFRGYEGLNQAGRELVGVLQKTQFVPERYVELGNRVVTVVRVYVTGRGSGVTSNIRVGHLWVLGAGRVVRWVVYRTPEEALAAVGLSD